MILKSGTFHKVAHDARGTATIYQLADGKRLLRFADFETSNGPDVQVYLVAAPDATDSKTVTQAGFVSLGPIRGSKGDQNYELPADLNLNKYSSVTVWCKRFGVNFATAPLAKS
ncbi:MAG TPA: DM13 domain-containing protein [Acidobacteriota bacterium]|nr:DM13 domain-containing protein [Acidobacteriota bacterium]